MIHFVRVTAKNFLSFKDLDYSFKNGPVLIQGSNETDDSQESNGSGKSALTAIVEYCLFKTTSRKVLDVDLIFFGEEEAQVSLEMYCDVREETMTVERKLKVRGSGELKLTSSKGEVKFSTVQDGGEVLIGWIGISKEDLINYYIINKERYRSFFSSSNTDKINLISRFSNSKLVDGVEKLVQAEIDSLNADLISEKMKRDVAIGAVKTYKSEKDKEYDRDFEQEYADRKIALESSIERYRENIQQEISNMRSQEGSIKTNREEISKMTSKIEEHRKRIEGLKEKIKTIDYSKVDGKIEETSEIVSSKNAKMGLLRENTSTLDELLVDINMNLLSSVQCPKCEHRFVVGNPDISIEAEEEEKLTTESLIKSNNQAIEDAKKEIRELQKTVDSLKEEKRNLYSVESVINDEIRTVNGMITNVSLRMGDIQKQIKSLENSINDKKEKIKNYENQIERVETEIRALKVSTVDMVRIDSLNRSMKGQGIILRDINEYIRELKDSIYKTSQWTVNFKRFEIHLANQSLRSIQGNCNKFLRDIGSDIQVKWEGYKMKSDKTTKEEITAYVIRDMRERNFWSLSGGERARLDYSMIFTIQHMINSTNKYGGLDFLSTDEISEGLDALGLSDLMKSLGRVKGTVLITTHVVNRNVSDSILLVRKVNGISTLN